VTIRLGRAALACLAAVLAFLALGVGPASAHVSVSSNNAAPGGFGEVTFNVPSESDTASTVSLKVQLPKDKPLAFVSVKPIPGWTVKETTEKVDPPITDDDGNQVTEAVSEITWTAGPGAGIKPGEYQTFSISAGPLPDAESLVLPAIQGYDDGTEVAWIDPTVEGQAEPEHPAPTLTLTAADNSGSQSPAPASVAPSDQGTSGLAVAALVIGALGLLAGIAGVVLALGARRRPAEPATVARERDTAAV
jgi:periplasmic copper chaperone A